MICIHHVRRHNFQRNQKWTLFPSVQGPLGTLLAQEAEHPWDPRPDWAGAEAAGEGIPKGSPPRTWSSRSTEDRTPHSRIPSPRCGITTASYLCVSPPDYHSSQALLLCRLGISLGCADKGEDIKRFEPCQAALSLMTTEHDSSLGPWLPGKPNRPEKCCRLADTSHNNSLKSSFPALQICTHLTHYQVMLKILQARLQRYVNQEIPDVQAGFRKGRGTRDRIANISWIIEKARELKKNIYLCIIDDANAFGWITTNCGQFLKKWEYQTTLPASWENCMQVKKQQSEPDMEQWTGSKLGEEYIKALYCHLACLTYMQSTSCEMPGWMKHKLESRLSGEISVTSDMQMIAHGKK